MNKNKITAYKSFTFDYNCLETLINETVKKLRGVDRERENTIKDWYIFFKTNINFELYNKYMHKYTSNIATIRLGNGVDIIKYFDFNRWICNKVNIFKFLNKYVNFHGKNVYDIGSGFGHFPLICKSYGANIVVGSNIPYGNKKYQEGELFHNICESFNLKTDVLYVKPKTPIILDMKYDFITFLMPRWFHRFTIEECIFFINDMKKNNLTKGGKIIFECGNGGKNKYEYLEKISLASCWCDGDEKPYKPNTPKTKSRFYII